MPTCWFPGVVLLIVNVVGVNVAVNPACECVVYQSYGASDGKFHSPNYPKHYSRGLDCILFTFIGDVDEIVELTFVEFDLKWRSPQGGCGDYLRLFLNLDRPEVDEHSRWDKELCGNISHLEQKTYYSKGRSLILEFHSDNHALGFNHRGFRGKFKFLDASRFVTMCQKILGTMCTYTCNHYPNQTGGNKFFSPRYPQNYPQQATCEYKFYAQPQEKVKVNFQNIQLYNKNNLPCANTSDLIEVYDGEDTKSPIIQTLCGDSNHETVTSSSQHLYIRFYSDGREEQKGFAATYEFLPKHITIGHRTTEKPQNINDSNLVNCNRKIISTEAKKSDVIMSQKFPGPYQTSTQCQYTFIGHQDERIQLYFTHMNLYYTGGNPASPTADCAGQDSITIFDLQHDIERELNVFCGQQQVPLIMSATKYMRVLFSSVSHRDEKIAIGFQFKYRFRTDFGIETGKQRSQGRCEFIYESRISKYGNFTSPNYPGIYPRNTTCHYIFKGEPNEKLTITFQDFHVEGVATRCLEDRNSDYVSFSNFKDAEDRKMSRLCGYIDKGKQVESDGAFFSVTFKSNFGFEGRGFKANYQFKIVQTVPPPLTEAVGSSSTVHTQTLCWRLVTNICSSLVTMFAYRMSLRS